MLPYLSFRNSSSVVLLVGMSNIRTWNIFNMCMHTTIMSRGTLCSSRQLYAASAKKGLLLMVLRHGDGCEQPNINPKLELLQHSDVL
jgi:hypothetical protein